MTDDHGGDIADQNRIAAGLGQHRILDVVDRADQADPAHDCRLRTEIDDVSADIQVAAAQCLQQLRQREVVGDELVEIDLQLEGFGLSAPADDIHDAWNGTEAALQNPVLQSLQVEHAVAGRTNQPVTIDFADGADRADGGLNAVRQSGELRQAVEDLLKRLVIGKVIGELQFDIRQAVKRNGSHDAQVRHAGKLRLDRNRDVAFDFFGRKSRALGDDINHGRNGIGIGLDVQDFERSKTAGQRHDEHDKHQNALPQRKRDDRVDHCGMPVFIKFV